jgi:hypothetical protein
MERSIYLDRDDCESIENEERSLFVRGILEEIGIPEESLYDVWPELELSIEHKMKLRKLLDELDLEIIYDGGRGVKIYHGNPPNGKLIAEWFKPRFIMKKDIQARDSNKKLYYEMVIKTWSAFEEENDDE